MKELFLIQDAGYRDYWEDLKKALETDLNLEEMFKDTQVLVTEKDFKVFYENTVSKIISYDKFVELIKDLGSLESIPELEDFNSKFEIFHYKLYESLRMPK